MPYIYVYICVNPSWKSWAFTGREGNPLPTWMCGSQCCWHRSSVTMSQSSYKEKKRSLQYHNSAFLVYKTVLALLDFSRVARETVWEMGYERVPYGHFQTANTEQDEQTWPSKMSRSNNLDRPHLWHFQYPLTWGCSQLSVMVLWLYMFADDQCTKVISGS